MAMHVNRAAVEHAKTLIEDGQYAINTVWSRNAPQADAENRYLETNGIEAFGRWYLAIDTDADADAGSAHQFPYGDFKRVHRSGVIAARQRAAQNGYHDVANAADELLDLFDRMNAC